MKFFFTIGLSITILCGMSYLSTSQWQVRQLASIQMVEFEDTTSETGTEEVELDEIIETIPQTPCYSNIYFKAKLNHLFSQKQTWMQHFVNEIATPPPEA